MTVRRTAIVAFCVLLCVPIAPLGGQEWARFRGPNGSGVSNANTVPVAWEEKSFNWRVRLPGKGHSSPILWGERVFLTSASEQSGARYALCLNAEDGRQLWSRPIAGDEHRKHELNSYASSTPAADARRVYLCWGSPKEFIVEALDHSGTLQWRIDLGPYKASHGFGGSPILLDGMVIIANEQSGDSSLVALDSRSGKLRWQVARESQASYSTPCVYRPEGHPTRVIFTNWENGITAIDPSNGEVAWEIQVFDQKHSETAIASPFLWRDLVIGTCGYLGYATQTVAVRPDNAQTGRAVEVYRLDRGAPLTTTPVAKDGLLYLWADNGIVTCADADSGRVFWRTRVGGTFYGSPVVVGDAVYCMSTDGQAVVLAASRDYELIARNPLGEGSHSTPAVGDGRLFLRTFSHLISLGGR